MGSSVFDSSCNSPCTSSVSCNSKATNNGIGQRGKLQLSDNTNRRGQGRIELNLHLTGRNSLTSVAPETLIDSDASLKCWGTNCQGPTKFGGNDLDLSCKLSYKYELNFLELKVPK